MMVVHEDTDTPTEVDVIRKPLLGLKSHVIVNNHVKELSNNDDAIPAISIRKGSPERAENIGKINRKFYKKHKKNEEIQAIPLESQEQMENATEIDKNDLQELRTVYMKCKEVMRKIKSKYGHLLDLDSDAGPTSPRKRKLDADETSGDECNCKLNTKIVFDEDGKQKTVEMVSEKHICVKNVKRAKRDDDMRMYSKNIAIEYTENEITLPGNLQELNSHLQDPSLEKTLRNKMVDKMKMLKQEYVNDIRFNKHSIIEKLKTNPDEELGFKGTNLSTIKGYL